MQVDVGGLQAGCQPQPFGLAGRISGRQVPGRFGLSQLSDGDPRDPHVGRREMAHAGMGKGRRGLMHYRANPLLFELDTGVATTREKATGGNAPPVRDHQLLASERPRDTRA